MAEPFAALAVKGRFEALREMPSDDKRTLLAGLVAVMVDGRVASGTSPSQRHGHVSMDRLARNLDELRKLVQSLNKRGIRIEFVMESLAFTGEDSPMANLMLSVMGPFAEFERTMIRERQREGIAIAKQRGAYRGGKKSLSDDKVAELERVADGEQKATIARDLGSARKPSISICDQQHDIRPSG